MEHEIAVVIPAHNEGTRIGALVRRLKENFATVIVVDDGSKDDTHRQAEQAGAFVLRHPHCRGKGAALKTAFSHACGRGHSAVITLDGDGQHCLDDIAGFLKAYRNKPRVAVWVGTRKIANTGMPFIRRLTNVVMSLLISGVARQYIPDTQSGYRLIRRDVLEKVKLHTDHFETESELLIRASWRGHRIGAVTISTIYGDEKSKIRPSKDTARFFKMLAGIFFCHSRG